MAKEVLNLEKIVKQYVDVLESQGIHVERVILYGSQASGAARDDSDIDIVVISKDFGRYDFPERLGFLSRATLRVPGALEVIGYTPDEIAGKSGKSIFWDEISKTGKVMYKAA